MSLRLSSSLVSLLGMLLVLSLTSACRSDATELRIGHKDFAEQKILGSILAQLAREAGYEVEQYNCVDTDGCQQDMREGRMDLMVEYTGTGSLYANQGDPRVADLESLRTRYASEGIEWLEPVGFENGYRVVMMREGADSLHVRRIEDLAHVEGVRVTCPTNFLQRPGDGLAALLRRHGLSLASGPLVLDGARERVAALRRGEADVAVLYGTDGALLSADLLSLEDSLGFFPRYDAVPLARSDAKINQELREKLLSLKGRFDNRAMQRLVYAVEVAGHAPDLVGKRALAGEAEAEDLDEGFLLLAESDGQDFFVQLAIASMRSAFPEQAVRLEVSSDASEALAQGKARLAVVGAEDFFGAEGVRDNRMEAIAVLGTRYLHLLRRRGDQDAGLDGLLAVPPAESSGGAIARAVLPSATGPRLRPMSQRAALAALRSQAVDAALIYSRLGATDLAKALGADLALRDFRSEGLVDGRPYLHVVRIPAATYPLQARAVETLAGQVLLAGQANQAAALTAKDVAALVQASGVHEQPDAILPSAARVPPPMAKPAVEADWMATFLNVFALAFLMFAGSLLWRPGIGRSLHDESQ